LIENFTEMSAEFKRKPQTPIEERRRNRYQAKQKEIASDKCVRW
jgi:hypothetical protein